MILLFSFVGYHEIDCLERTEHFLYCILYAFISILCRPNLLFVTLVLPFFELCSAISSLWASIWSNLSTVDQNRERMMCFLFLPKKICLNKLVWLNDRCPWLCQLICPSWWRSASFSILWMELESSVCLLFGHFCHGLAVMLIYMDFQFHVQFHKFGLSHPGSDYSGCCDDMQCLKWKIFRIGL